MRGRGRWGSVSQMRRDMSRPWVRRDCWRRRSDSQASIKKQNAGRAGYARLRMSAITGDVVGISFCSLRDRLSYRDVRGPTERRGSGRHSLMPIGSRSSTSSHREIRYTTRLGACPIRMTDWTSTVVGMRPVRILLQRAEVRLLSGGPVLSRDA